MDTQQRSKPVRHRGHNEGSISKTCRNGKIRAFFTLPTGQRVSKSFSNSKDCKAWLFEMRKEVEKGYRGIDSKITLQAYLEDWITHQAKLKEKTKQEYIKHITKYISPKLGELKISNLKRQDVERFYLKLLECTTPGMSTHIHRTLHSALEDAVEQGILLVNPSHHADRVIPDHSSKGMGYSCNSGLNFWNDDEARSFLIAAKFSPYEALYHLALKIGARQGELLGLKWGDVDWKTERITIQRQYQSIHNGAGYGLFTTPKSNSSRRTVQLGKEMIAALRKHQAKQVFNKAIAGSRWQENDLIFPSATGTPKNASNITRDFKEVTKKAGVKKIRFHDLRHTAATLMLNHGIPAIVVSGILGHSNTSVTLTIYGHLLTDQQLPAAQLMDSLVTPIPIDPDLVHTNPTEKVSRS